jgi:hypothetical protein
VRKETKVEREEEKGAWCCALPRFRSVSSLLPFLSLFSYLDQVQGESVQGGRRVPLIVLEVHGRGESEQRRANALFCGASDTRPVRVFREPVEISLPRGGCRSLAGRCVVLTPRRGLSKGNMMCSEKREREKFPFFHITPLFGSSPQSKRSIMSSLRLQKRLAASVICLFHCRRGLRGRRVPGGRRALLPRSARRRPSSEPHHAPLGPAASTAQPHPHSASAGRAGASCKRGVGLMAGRGQASPLKTPRVAPAPIVGAPPLTRPPFSPLLF